MSQLKINCVLFCMTFFLRLSSSNNNNTLLIVISFDGFRYDYFNRNLTDTLVNLRRNSSYASYMNSVFPTKTFPNHFSISTGLYTEIHGVLDNKVYDQSSNKILEYGYELFHYNEDVVPLWILNERGGEDRRSGCMMWPGSDFKYQGTSPSRYMNFNSSVSWEQRVDTLLSWFQDPDTPINLGMLYFEQPDTICHLYGPDSDQVNREISRVDRIVQYLLMRAEAVQLLDKLNIILLSDHGGQAVKYPTNIINLDNFIDNTWYKQAGVPPNLQIYPVKGREKEVLEKLRSARTKSSGYFTTFSHAEIPDRWHYKHCRRSPPILVIADLGYLFLINKKFSMNSSVIGNHGWDPLQPSMRAFFMATGPLIKRNYPIAPFENIHIFPLAVHMLGLTLPAVKPNGSLSFLQEILVGVPVSTGEEPETTFHIGVGLLMIAVGAVLGLIWFIVCRNGHCKTKKRSSSTASYR